MKDNSPEIWDAVWADPGLVREDRLMLLAEKETVRWWRVRELLVREFGKIEGLEVIELGAGIGTYGALLAQEGASVTLVDYSQKALERAREFWEHNGLTAKMVLGNVFSLPRSLSKKRFDVALSIGLAEHFRAEKRVMINQRHLDVLKDGGLAVIAVPNSFNPPYQIFKWVSEWIGTWKFGEEYPYSRKELLSMGDRIQGRTVEIFGDDLYSSLRFLLPANFLRRWLGVGLPRNEKEIRKEQGTWLDNYLGYCLVWVVGKKM